MPVWNPEAIDYDAGVYEQGGLVKANKIGCWVMTKEEADECLRKRGYEV